MSFLKTIDGDLLEKGVLHHKGILFRNLDEATKEKVLKIMEQVKSGEITRTEAQQQLKELGINLKIDIKEKLNDTTKEKVQ